MPLDYWVREIRRDRLKRLAAILLLLNVVLYILLQGKPSFSNASKPWLLGSAVLSLEFVRDVKDVDMILSNAPSVDREAMRIKTYIDFAYIGSYTALGVVLSLLLARSGGWKVAAAIAAAICAVAAGVFDVFENFAILKLLDVPLKETTTAMLNTIRVPAVIKFALVGIGLLLLCSYFVKPSKRENESAT